MVKAMNTPYPTQQTSFCVSRPGLQPGYRVKFRLGFLDTMNMVASMCSILVYGAVFGGLAWNYLTQRQPNGGLPWLQDFLLVTFMFVMTYMLLIGFARYIIKALLLRCGFYTREELSYFPLDTDGNPWSYPRGPLKPWPIAWQEPIAQQDQTPSQPTN